MSRGYVITPRPVGYAFVPECGILATATLQYRAGWVNISGVDFGCFSTVYRDCEALKMREEQVNFTLLFLYTHYTDTYTIPKG